MKREQDAGILMVGHAVTPGMVIPPGADNYTVSGYCSGSCTQQVTMDTCITFYKLHFSSLYHQRELRYSPIRCTLILLVSTLVSNEIIFSSTQALV